jgi:hypothetical protein
MLFMVIAHHLVPVLPGRVGGQKSGRKVAAFTQPTSTYSTSKMYSGWCSSIL